MPLPSDSRRTFSRSWVLSTFHHDDHVATLLEHPCDILPHATVSVFSLRRRPSVRASVIDAFPEVQSDEGKLMYDTSCAAIYMALFMKRDSVDPPRPN